MKIFLTTLSYLSLRERYLVAVAVLIRVALVIFDLAGIFLVGVVVSLISGTVISATSPLHSILAWLTANGFRDGYVVLAAVAVVFFIAKGLLSVILGYLTAAYVARIESSKAARVYAGFVRSTLSDVEKFNLQELMTGLTTSMNSAFAGTINIGAAMIGELALLLGVSAYLAYVNALLFVGVALFFGFVGLMMQMTIGRGSGRAAQKAHDGQLKSHGLVINSLNNFRQLVASGSHLNFEAKFRRERSETAHQNAVYATFTTLPRYITEVSVMVGVGILVLQRSQSSGAGVSAATIAVFLAGIFRIVASMLPLQAGLSALKRIGPESQLAFSLLSEFSMEPVASPSLSYKAGPKEIRIKDLTFGYEQDARTIFDGVSLVVPAGTYVAITGKSGAGKSTLADLVLGLRTPTSGSVTVGGLSPADLRSSRAGAIGYVPQRTSLIPGTVIENVLLEVEPKSVDEVRLEAAISSAGLESVIDSLPEGMRTLIGDGAIELSGGQTQRIGLARALYHNPDILVLDEATSALDQETELFIHDALLERRGKLTILVIAHRPQTLRDADLVVEVGGGALQATKRK